MSGARAEPVSFSAWRNRELAVRDLLSGLVPQLLLFLFTYYGWSPSSEDVSSNHAVPWLQAAHGACANVLAAGGPALSSSGAAASARLLLLRGVCGPLMQHHYENLFAVVGLMLPILVFLISRQLYTRWRIVLIALARFTPMVVMAAATAASSPEQLQRRLTTSFMFYHPANERLFTARFPGWTGWQVHQWLTAVAMWWEAIILPLPPRVERSLSWAYTLLHVYIVSCANAALGHFSWGQTLLFGACSWLLMVHLAHRGAVQLEARMRQRYAAAMAAAAAGSGGASQEGASSAAAASSVAVPAGLSKSKGDDKEEEEEEEEEWEQPGARLPRPPPTSAAARGQRSAAGDGMQPEAQQQPQPRGLPALGPAPHLAAAAPGDAAVTPGDGGSSGTPSSKLYVASGQQQQQGHGIGPGGSGRAFKSGQHPPVQGEAAGSSGCYWRVSLLRHAPLCLLAGDAQATGQEVQLHLMLRQGSGAGGAALGGRRCWRRQDSAAEEAGSSSFAGGSSPMASPGHSQHSDGTTAWEVHTGGAFAEGGTDLQQPVAEVEVPSIMPWQHQVHDLAGCLGDVVVSLMAGSDVAASWTWVEAELLSLLRAQAEEQLSSGHWEEATEGWPLVLDLQLPGGMAPGCDELLVTHYPPGSPSACANTSPASSQAGSPRAGERQPQEEEVVVAQVLLCALPEPAWREVHQVLLPGMLEEAHDLLLLHQQNSSSSSSSSCAAVEEAALQLVWSHWCSLCGDMRRLIDLGAQHAAATAAAGATSPAFQAATLEVAARLAPHGAKAQHKETDMQHVGADQDNPIPATSSSNSDHCPAFQQVAHHLLAFLGQHRLSCCAEFVVGLLRPDLARPWLAAYQRQQAALDEQQAVLLALQGPHPGQQRGARSAAAGSAELQLLGMGRHQPRPSSYPPQMQQQQQQQQQHARLLSGWAPPPAPVQAQQQQQVVPVQQVVLWSGSVAVISAAPAAMALPRVPAPATATAAVAATGGDRGLGLGAVRAGPQAAGGVSAPPAAAAAAAAAAAGPSSSPHPGEAPGAPSSHLLWTAQGRAVRLADAAGSSRAHAGLQAASDTNPTAAGASREGTDASSSRRCSMEGAGSGASEGPAGEEYALHREGSDGSSSSSLRQALTSCSASSMHGSSSDNSSSSSSGSSGCGWGRPDALLLKRGDSTGPLESSASAMATATALPGESAASTSCQPPSQCSGSSSTNSSGSGSATAGLEQQCDQSTQAVVAAGGCRWCAAAAMLLLAALLPQLPGAGGVLYGCAALLVVAAAAAAAGLLLLAPQMPVDRRSMAPLLAAAVAVPFAVAACLATWVG